MDVIYYLNRTRLPVISTESKRSQVSELTRSLHRQISHAPVGAVRHEAHARGADNTKPADNTGHGGFNGGTLIGCLFLRDAYICIYSTNAIVIGIVYLARLW